MPSDLHRISFHINSHPITSYHILSHPPKHPRTPSHTPHIISPPFFATSIICSLAFMSVDDVYLCLLLLFTSHRSPSHHPFPCTLIIRWLFLAPSMPYISFYFLLVINSLTLTNSLSLTPLSPPPSSYPRTLSVDVYIEHCQCRISLSATGHHRLCVVSLSVLQDRVRKR